ncbi:hypothetical protein DF051_14145 [Burkholderia contaminans]|uniref:Uncharacterized protein n=1 Tax=Burkholderia contaminans TaxID=488447 RepID=A0A3N8RDC9_9BURK|nr:hypothetical protein DF051_14145 [Burkholderia contaminans]
MRGQRIRPCRAVVAVAGQPKQDYPLSIGRQQSTICCASRKKNFWRRPLPHGRGSHARRCTSASEHVQRSVGISILRDTAFTSGPRSWSQPCEPFRPRRAVFDPYAEQDRVEPLSSN